MLPPSQKEREARELTDVLDATTMKRKEYEDQIKRMELEHEEGITQASLRLRPALDAALARIKELETTLSLVKIEGRVKEVHLDSMS